MQKVGNIDQTHLSRLILRMLLLGLAMSFWVLAKPIDRVYAQCGIPGQYEDANGECKCPAGTYHSRETVACEQETCPEGAGRTYTLECACGEDLEAEITEYTTETGHPYSLVTACVAPKSIWQRIAGWLLPSRERFAQGWDALTHSGGADIIERTAGAVSLAGAAAEVVLVLTGVTALTRGAVKAVGARLVGRTAVKAAGKMATGAAEELVIKMGAGELPQITYQTRNALAKLISQMKQAGMLVNKRNILDLINQARQARGLPADFTMSSLENILEILHKGLG